MIRQQDFKLIDGGGTGDRFMALEAQINLNETGYYALLDTRRWEVAAVSMVAQLSWATAVVEMKWLIDESALPASLVPAIRFTGTSLTQQSIDVSTVPFIGFYVTTAEGSAKYATARVYLTRKGV